MKILFVHGWSVRNTDTYGALPRWLAQQRGPDGRRFKVGDLFLGKYISFDDAVTVDDLARALDYALARELGPSIRAGERLAAVTHSLGGPIVRTWMERLWKRSGHSCPLSHLILLAPANHGSALAQLGKGRLSRLRSFFQGGEPGQRLLDWLELGSDESWSLNARWLECGWVRRGVYPFVLTGQRIDRKLYDALNTYTGEPGSDGVVRAAAANLNYSLLRLGQEDGRLTMDTIRRAERTAFGLLPGLAHCGADRGILGSVSLSEADSHVTAQWVLRCLQVESVSDYRRVCGDLDRLTVETQAQEHEERVPSLLGARTYLNPRHSMVVFRVVGDPGDGLEDYDLYFTAGPDFSEDELPSGFCRDRQRNLRNRGKLTYYLDYDALSAGLRDPRLGGRLGFRVVARPAQERRRPKLVYYRPLDYRGTMRKVGKFLLPNQTAMVEIRLQRCVDAAIFRVERTVRPSVIQASPCGERVP